MRLIGGSSYREGRVEVFYNGAWGTVCDDDWDLNDAHVVCRSMGFGDAREATTWASFGRGSVNIAFDNVGCSGNERSIFDCSNMGYRVHDCRHSGDAGVKCSGEYLLFNVPCAIPPFKRKNFVPPTQKKKKKKNT